MANFHGVCIAFCIFCHILSISFGFPWTNNTESSLRTSNRVPYSTPIESSRVILEAPLVFFVDLFWCCFGFCDVLILRSLKHCLKLCGDANPSNMLAIQKERHTVIKYKASSSYVKVYPPTYPCCNAFIARDTVSCESSPVPYQDITVLCCFGFRHCIGRVAFSLKLSFPWSGFVGGLVQCWRIPDHSRWGAGNSEDKKGCESLSESICPTSQERKNSSMMVSLQILAGSCWSILLQLHTLLVGRNWDWNLFCCRQSNYTWIFPELEACNRDGNQYLVVAAVGCQLHFFPVEERDATLRSLRQLGGRDPTLLEQETWIDGDLGFSH